MPWQSGCTAPGSHRARIVRWCWSCTASVAPSNRPTCVPRRSGLLRAGYPVARVDLRGVGDSSEHCQMLYHGGRSEDLRTVLGNLAQQPDVDGVALVGFSLGGNVTLKLLGEPLDGLPIRAGVAVSAPVDLSVGNEHLRRRMFGLYEKFLVHRLKVDSGNSGLALTDDERAAIAQVSTLTEFDDLITAKHNGWRDAAEYYAVNSSAQFLPSITVPTLVVHGLDDPMIPAGPYHAIDWARSGGDDAGAPRHHPHRRPRGLPRAGRGTALVRRPHGPVPRRNLSAPRARRTAPPPPRTVPRPPAPHPRKISA